MSVPVPLISTVFAAIAIPNPLRLPDVFALIFARLVITILPKLLTSKLLISLLFKSRFTFPEFTAAKNICPFGADILPPSTKISPPNNPIVCCDCTAKSP